MVGRAKLGAAAPLLGSECGAECEVKGEDGNVNDVVVGDVSDEPTSMCSKADRAHPYEKYLEDRKWLWPPLLFTAISMMAMGSVCSYYELRIQTPDDAAQTHQTIMINFLVLVVLLMVCLSDASVDQNKECENFTSTIRELAQRGNQVSFVAAVVSISMPVQGLVVLLFWRHEGKMVPLHRSNDWLPGYLNTLFLVGMFAYMFSTFWLALSAMSRPVRQTWHYRTEMIKKIKAAKTAEAWDERVHELAHVDHELTKMWHVKRAGGLWCAAMFACLLNSAVSLLNILGVYDSLENDKTEFFKQAGMQIVQLLVGTLLATVLGLVLASTTFVAPLRLPDFFSNFELCT